MVVGGVLLEIIILQTYTAVTKKKLRKDHFSYGRYFFLFLFPFIGLFYLTRINGVSILHIFSVFLLLGAMLEWFVGFSYHMIVGQRLWTYHRFSLNGYTSWLTIPIWGLGGVFFWLLAKLF